jgi:signal transduction histidine kinase
MIINKRPAAIAVLALPKNATWGAEKCTYRTKKGCRFGTVLESLFKLYSCITFEGNKTSCMRNSFLTLQNIMRNKHGHNSLMELSAFGYMWAKVNSKKIIASHTIYSLLEMEPFAEFLTIEKWRSYIHPADVHKLFHAEQQLLQTGDPSLAEYRLITEKGRLKFVNHHMSLSLYPPGEGKIMSIVQDVTEQKSAEVILDSMNENFFELDELFALSRINAHALKFWGLRRSDPVGENLLTLFPQFENSAFYEVLQKAESEKINIAQDVIDPVTGHWLHLSVSPYSDGLIAIFYDIQAEKEAERKIAERTAELKKQHNILQQAEELANMGSWEYDVNTKEFIWSDGMYRLFDLEKKKPVRPAVYTEHSIKKDLAIAKKIVNAIETSFEPFEEVMEINNGGANKVLKIKAAPFKNENGEVERMLGVDVDITERQESEEKIRELNRSLSAMNKDLNILNSELRHFNSIAANNYSETLRHVYINLETIVTTDARNLSNSGRANIRRAQAAVQKMKLLTNDINKYLELYDAGVKKELISPNNLLIDVKEKIQKRIEDSNATINVAELPVIHADPKLFSKLMTNLIENSIKYKKADLDPVIDISSSLIAGQDLPSKNAGNRSYIIITIKDNGIGFKQEDEDKVFELFTQLDEVKYKGSGIGLAICKKIMERHGGFIAAASAPGTGTSINCYFPA